MVEPGKTLYRGVNKKFETTQSGFWSAFSSTSLNINVARGFAGSNGTIFEIRLSQTEPHPNASISNVSAYPSEEEVLILPFFPIKEISRKDDGDLTYISL